MKRYMLTVWYDHIEDELLTRRKTYKEFLWTIVDHYAFNKKISYEIMTRLKFIGNF